MSWRWPAQPTFITGFAAKRPTPTRRSARALARVSVVPFVSERADVAGLARAQKRSTEDAARTMRYAFLERAADALGADAIAVAHTRDDQAETFLLRLLRGAGTRGLGSIRPRAGRVIRPLIDVERAGLRDYLGTLGETWREDATNLDLAIPRNRDPPRAHPVSRITVFARRLTRFSPAPPRSRSRMKNFCRIRQSIWRDRSS